jgi:hypothetical protein
VIRLKLEMYQLPRCAVLLDGYNALFWQTEYFEATSLTDSLRRIDAQELTLGANLRVLSDHNVGKAVVAAAVTLSTNVPDVPADLDGENAPYTCLTVPPLSVEELGTMILYYRCVTKNVDHFHSRCDACCVPRAPWPLQGTRLNCDVDLSTACFW